MKYLSLFLLFILKIFITLASTDGIILSISDTVEIKSKNGRIETIEINVEVLNNTSKHIFLNKQIGVTEIGSLLGEYIDGFCDKYDYRGRYLFFLYNSSNQPLIESSLLSVGDYVYFTKNGNLKYVYLEGIDNPRKIKEEFNKSEKQSSKLSVISLNPNERINFFLKIYLGDFIFEKNQTYYLILVYNNKTEGKLSNICLESNKMVLKVK